MTRFAATPFVKAKLRREAMACYVAGRFEEAARIFGDVLPRIVSPKLPGAWELYGEALARLGRLEDAAKIIEGDCGTTIGPGSSPIKYW